MSAAIRWTDAELTMKEFVEKFRRCLPLLCTVTSGYAGSDEDIHQIGAGEVYWIYGIETQRRIVARPKEVFDCFICIPIDYPLQVQIINSEGTVGAAASIVDVEERLVSGSEPVYFQFERNQSVPFLSGDCMQKTTQMGELQAEDTYEEKYLLAYSVHGGKICSQTIAIPVYLDITLSTCEQLTQTPRGHDYQRWMEDVNDITRTFQNNPIKMCKEIIAFNQTPSGGDYEYLNPSLLVGVRNSFLMSSSSSSSSSSEDKHRKKGKGEDGEYLNSRIQNDYNDFSKQQKRTSAAPSAVQSKSSSGPLLRTELSFPLPPFPGSSPPGSGRDDQQKADPKAKRRSEGRKPVPPPTSKPALPRPDLPEKQSPGTSISGEERSKQGSRKPPPPPRPVNRRVTSPGVTAERSTDPPPPPPPPPSNRYVAMDDIPPDADIGSLTMEEVGSMLRLLNLDGHVGSFERRQIDGALLLRISEESLRQEFRLTVFEAKKLTMFIREGWRPKKHK